MSRHPGQLPVLDALHVSRVRLGIAPRIDAP